MTQHLLPDLPGFSIEQMSITNGVITVLACSQTASGVNSRKTLALPSFW